MKQFAVSYRHHDGSRYRKSVWAFDAEHAADKVWYGNVHIAEILSVELV